MRNLDEEIRYCEEVAEEQENKASFNEYRFKTKHIEVYERQWKNCKECASEHRQLAEWLRELKDRQNNRAHFIGFENPNYSPFENTPKIFMTCSKCGNVVSDAYLYCPMCGAKFEEVKAQMNERMTFPNSIYEFLFDYSFKDEEEVYTNGSLLIPTFRVKQAIEHYFEEVNADAPN